MFLKISYLLKSKEFFRIVNIHLGVMLLQEFNDIPAAQVGFLNHFRISLDRKLNFDENLRNTQSEMNRIIGIIRNLQRTS